MCRWILGFILFTLYFPVIYAANTVGNFLTISDIHYNYKANQVSYGEDTGNQLMRNALDKLKITISTLHPKFILFLGDAVAHHVSNSTRIIEDRYVLEQLRKLAGSSTALFFVTGNNGPLGGDYHSFTNAEGLNVFSLDPNHGWPGINAAAHCTSSLNQACLLNLPYENRYGFYSAYPLGPSHPLRLIVLNTVIFSQQYVNDYGMTQKTVAQLEINWLAKQLKQAAEKNESVILAMHIPPGNSSFSNKPMWNASILLANKLTIQTNFLNLIKQYQKNIKGILAGHTHFDQIRLMMNTKKHVIAVVTFTPGITPEHGNNPGFKDFSFDLNNYALMNYTTYFTLPTANSWASSHYTFSQLYSCKLGIKICLASLQSKRIYAAMNSEYAVGRKNYKPPQGWKNVDKDVNLMI